MYLGGRLGSGHRDMIVRYWAKYGKWIPRADEFPIRPLCPREFQAFCRKAKNSGGGMDGWCGLQATPRTFG